MKRSSRKATVIFGILSLLILCFIWGQSMLPRSASADESNVLMRLMKPILAPKNRADDDIFHHYLRKTAHFVEYAALGFCMCCFFRKLEWKRNAVRTVVTIISPILAAAIDETIQIFTPNRGPQFSDVLLDSCGALCGIGVFLFLAHCFRSILKKN